MKAVAKIPFSAQSSSTTEFYSIRDKLAETIVQSDLDHIADALYPKATAQALPPRPYRPSKIKGRSQNGAGVPFLERNPDQRLFRFHQGGYLRGLLSDAMKQAGLSFPPRQRGFHLTSSTAVPVLPSATCARPNTWWTPLPTISQISWPAANESGQGNRLLASST
jgi:hypothetical protein